MSDSYLVSLTRDDLLVIHNALECYLSDFGHDEADLVARIRSVSSTVSRAIDATDAVPHSAG